MTQISPQFKYVSSLSELDKIVDRSRTKPVLIFKHGSTTPASIEKKMELENSWSIPESYLDVYIVDHLKHKEVSEEVSELAGIQSEVPQVVLFADGVTMYDETGDLISLKKIKLALKIVNRTFKWMETRA